MAGNSRGAFYSHFKSKDDLVCAVLEHEIRRGHEQLDVLFAQEQPPPERLKQIRAYYVSVVRDVDGCMFWMSMHMYALRNPDVRPRIAALLRSDRVATVEYVRRTFEELGIEPPFPPGVLALMLIAEAQGLTLSRMVEPEAITLEQAEQALGGYFDRLVGL